ncbi:hypothetical protein [Nitratireductor sp.]|uniref:hypothetical protein n=1 Tax=Nitratireductor sp. TaxID=1872084 RepID=UPI00262C9A1A|nr:hypothetical protein [Nitratireductor sp.]
MRSQEKSPNLTLPGSALAKRAPDVVARMDVERNLPVRDAMLRLRWRIRDEGRGSTDGGRDDC